MTPAEDELERLHRRLERERRARRQAEIIAERGMRELWAANSELRDRVTTRTAELECALRALELTELATAQVVSGLVDGLTPASTTSTTAAASTESSESSGRIVVGGGPEDVLARVRDVVDGTTARPRASTADQPFDVDPVAIADRLVERWQHPAARSGQLLSVEVATGSGPVVADWALVQAVADAALDDALRRSAPGALTVTLTAEHDGVRVAVRNSGPSMGDDWSAAARRRPLDATVLGDAAVRFALLDALTAGTDAVWDVVGDTVGTTVTLFVPAA